MPIQSQVPSFRRLYYRFNLYAVICRNKLILATQNHLTTFINGTYRAFPVSSRCLREDPAEVLLSDLLELVERFVVVLREDDVMAALSSFSMSSISLSFKSVDAGLFFTDSELTFPKSSKFKHPALLHRVWKLATILAFCVYLYKSDSGPLNHSRASKCLPRVSATRCWTSPRPWSRCRSQYCPRRLRR